MEITRRKLRHINHSLSVLYSRAGLQPLEVGGTNPPAREFFSHMLQLSGYRYVQLTERGFSELRNIVKHLHSLDMFGDRAAYSDIWSATKSVIESLLSEDQMPDDGIELAELVRKRVEPEIIERTFAVPVYGIELDAKQSVSLGGFILLPPDPTVLRGFGLSIEKNHISNALESIGNDPLLLGRVTGTKAVAADKYRSQAELILGLLATFVGANYENGATNFRFGLKLSAESTHSRAKYFSWTGREEDASVHYAFPAYQLLKLNAFEERLLQGGQFQRGLRAIESERKTDLEEDLVKALYWFLDAQRDSVPVMQFVKYWSCVETFLSKQGETFRSVSTGLATVLVAGGGDFFKASDYPELKRQISELYLMRCRAVHGGAYQHVTKQDVANLSQWTSWMLIIMINLIEHDYTTSEAVRAQTKRIDTILTKSQGGPNSS